MRTRTLFPLVFVLAALAAVPAQAQNSSAVSHCIEILRQGVYDYYFEKNSSIQLSDVRSAILDASSSTSGSSQGGGASVSFGPFSFGGTYSSSEAKAASELFTKSDSDLFSKREDLLRDIKRINPAALTAFNQCVALGDKGVVTAYSMRPDFGAFGLSVRYAGNGAETKLQRLQMSPTGAFSCTGTLAEKATTGGRLTNNAFNMLCTRSMTRTNGYRLAPEATLTIDSDNGQIVYHFPALTGPVAREPAPVPIGTVMAFVGAMPPEGWLLCNGNSYSATEYPELAAVLGNTFKAGANPGQFRVPDLRGLFIRGLNGDAAGVGRDPDGINRTLGSVQSFATARPAAPFTTDSKGSHNHGGRAQIQITGCDTVQEDTDCSGGEINIRHAGSGLSSDGQHDHIVAGGGDTETRPANMALNYIIQAGRKQGARQPPVSNR